MKKIAISIFLVIFVICNLFSQVSSKFDINSATKEQVYSLLLPEFLKENIYNYLTYRGKFKNIYSMNDIEGITPEYLSILKSSLIVEPILTEDNTADKLDDAFYIFQRLGTDEGFREGITDEWEDQLLSPKNINNLTYREILNYPSVSDVDASAVANFKASNKKINDSRSLRNINYLSYYGYRNLSNYVDYKATDDKLHFHYQFKFNNVPYFDETESVLLESVTQVQTIEDKSLTNTFYGKFGMENPDFSQTHKFRARYGDKIKGGLISNRNLGEENEHYKAYLGFENFYENKIISIKKVYLGNYRVAFGSGLVMENTDFYIPRKTGMGFGKSILGLIGDVSTTEEFKFFGSAIEVNLFDNLVNAVVFYSDDKKDVIVDGQDNVVSYIVLKPRPTTSLMEDVQNEIDSLDYLGLRIEQDYLQEKTFGYNVEVNYLNSFLGFSFYQSIYNKKFAPLDPTNWGELLNSEANGYEISRNGKIHQNDNEFFKLYDSGTKDYRRFLGFNFKHVHRELAFEGEVGVLDANGDFVPNANDPKAYSLKAYLQKNSIYLLALFRDVDIDYDNPYARGFSEKKRFDDTMFDKYPYALNNPLLANLYLNSPWMQAEKGFYLETRYQISKSLTITKAYLDIFKRKSDGRPTTRFQYTLRFQPIHQIRIDWRQKILVNNSYNLLARGISKTYNTYLRATYNLSKFDRISLSYNYEQTYFPPYPYLSNNAEPGIDNLGTGGVLLKGDAISVRANHHLSDNFNIEGAFCLFNTNGTSLYDFEDVEIDFIEGRGFKTWLAMSNKVSDNIVFRIKYKFKHYSPRTRYLRKWWNDPVDNSEGDNPYYYLYSDMDRSRTDEHLFRIQLDYLY